MIYIAISVYIIILLILFIYYFVIEKGLKFIYANLIYSIENLNYEFVLLFYKNSTKLVKFDESIEVLFDNKTKYLKNFSYEINFFKNYLVGLKNDFGYLEELVSKKMFDTNKILIVEDLLNTARKIDKPFNIIRKFLYVMTLGIFIIYVSIKKYY